MSVGWFASSNGGGEFLPSSISGLFAWWDADDAATVVDGGSGVESWTDKAGSSFVMQPPSVAARPATATSVGFGGGQRTYISFDGSDDELEVTGTGLSTGARTVLIAAHHRGGSGVQNFFNDGGGDWWTDNGNGFLRVWDGGSTRQVSIGNVENPSVLVRTHKADGTHDVWVDGVKDGISGGTSTNNSGGTINVGGSFDPNRYGNWDAGEILIYDRELSDGEIVDVTNYLSTKWV